MQSSFQLLHLPLPVEGGRRQLICARILFQDGNLIGVEGEPLGFRRLGGVALASELIVGIGAMRDLEPVSVMTSPLLLLKQIVPWNIR